MAKLNAFDLKVKFRRLWERKIKKKKSLTFTEEKKLTS